MIYQSLFHILWFMPYFQTFEKTLLNERKHFVHMHGGKVVYIWRLRMQVLTILMKKNSVCRNSIDLRILLSLSIVQFRKFIQYENF